MLGLLTVMSNYLPRYMFRSKVLYYMPRSEWTSKRLELGLSIWDAWSTNIGGYGLRELPLASMRNNSYRGVRMPLPSSPLLSSGATNGSWFRVPDGLYQKGRPVLVCPTPGIQWQFENVRHVVVRNGIPCSIQCSPERQAYSHRVTTEEHFGDKFSIVSQRIRL